MHTSFVRVLAAVSLAAMVTACGGPSAYGPGAQGTSPPPLPANAALPKWEHYCVAPGGKYLDEVLSAAGALGWELVTTGMIAGETLFCFKRPLVAPAPTPPDSAPPS